MKAAECHLSDLISPACQYVVPSFQQPYQWDDERWMTFFSGVIEAFERTPPHELFLGALAIMPIGSTRSGLRKYILVDGQHRLITMFALLAALRDILRTHDVAAATQLEQQCLLNRDETGSYRYKLLPLGCNRPSFFQALGDGVLAGDDVFPAADFFLHELEMHRQLDYHALCDFLLTRFIAVRIELDRNENPYPIFRSLNMNGESFRQRWEDDERAFADDPQLMAMIAGGESDQLEFKEGLIPRGQQQPAGERHGLGIVRSVAGFMNSPQGGTILLGVTDEGRVRGINHEYRVVDPGKSNWDGYALHLQNMLRARLEIEAPFRFYSITRHDVRGHEICAIRVSPAEAPVYVDKRLQVRSGNQTVEMRGPDLVVYVNDNWPQ
jgi:hypothetical protein